MFSAAFIFRPGSYDDEFHRLNNLIDAAAKECDLLLGNTRGAKGILGEQESPGSQETVQQVV